MMFIMANAKRSGISKKPLESMKTIITAVCGIFVGFFIGVCFSSISFSKFDFQYKFLPVTFRAAPLGDGDSDLAGHVKLNSNQTLLPTSNGSFSAETSRSNSSSEIYAPSNPRGAESLPPGIVEHETDLYTHRLWGKPSEDLPFKPKYLVVFTVGFKQRDIVNHMVSKFSNNFTILLFHYDGRTSEWDQFEWSERAIHVSAKKQTKWWFAKRFLHPDVVAPFEYIFIWDEDLGVEHFDAELYVELVRKHGLEISQPGLEPNRALVWQMTRRRDNVEVHKTTDERPGLCRDPSLPPCAGFVEIMAPVFSQKAWRCVWHLIQNDLVHGWGLDFALRRCAEPAYQKIGVVDAQWIVHKVVPSLGSQGESVEGKQPWKAVRDRCFYEWEIFRTRLERAEKEYMKGVGLR